MASKGVELSLLLVLALMLCHGATAQSGCTNVVMSLAPCLNYVTGNSSTPSSSCCSKLANVVQSQPQCLCALLNDGGSSVGVNINQTLALSLPGACDVQTPPVSRCNSANGPASSPASPPADSSDDTPSIPSIPGGSGSKTVPTADGTSDASITRIQLQLTLFIISIVLCASNAMGF
ncbi:non-specific lipid transfer protein GPI-anchored 5 [Manihot esculenta]|uniref:Bifunctional inhibitor/plant lipid transfer protein/seed storage helical domain-containing protein n=1 Tax=Manihot esculenta TaxID=3983 RepID=A0A2C9VWI4_MANES|nr:non-specific lipid transfer protein GPI-anchored 5 [Manihot esculenta]OAY49742.1 hypothetical protein MANES_05G079400v8 [Manihot esculenta]